MGAVVGTIALIAVPSLVFGFWPQIRKALREPASPGGRGWRRERTSYWDPSALSRRQLLWVWVFAGWPVAVLYAAAPTRRRSSSRRSASPGS